MQASHHTGYLDVTRVHHIKKAAMTTAQVQAIHHLIPVTPPLNTAPLMWSDPPNQTPSLSLLLLLKCVLSKFVCVLCYIQSCYYVNTYTLPLVLCPLVLCRTERVRDCKLSDKAVSLVFPDIEELLPIGSILAPGRLGTGVPTAK